MSTNNEGTPRTPRPKKGELRIEMFYSHGDWTEPWRFGKAFSLNCGLMLLKRPLVREFVSTAAQLFHEEVQSTFFMGVSDTEQRRREIKWAADSGVPIEPEVIETPIQKVARLERDLTATKQRLERMEKALRGVLNSAVHPDIALRAVMVDLAPVRAALHPSADKAESNEDNTL